MSEGYHRSRLRPWVLRRIHGRVYSPIVFGLCEGVKLSRDRTSFVNDTSLKDFLGHAVPAVSIENKTEHLLCVRPLSERLIAATLDDREANKNSEELSRELRWVTLDIRRSRLAHYGSV